MHTILTAVVRSTDTGVQRRPINPATGDPKTGRQVTGMIHLLVRGSLIGPDWLRDQGGQSRGK